MTLQRLTALYVDRALRQYQTIPRTAEALGIGRATLYRWLKSRPVAHRPKPGEGTIICRAPRYCFHCGGVASLPVVVEGRWTWACSEGCNP